MPIVIRRAPLYAVMSVSVASIAIVVAFGLIIRGPGNGPLGADLWWHDFVGVNERSPAFVVADALARVGSALGVALCGVSIAVLLFYREFRRRSSGWQRWRDSCALITAMLIGVLCSESIKQLIARPRPADALIHASGLSYPSGHSMGAAVLAVSVLLIASERVSRTAVRWVMFGAAIWILAMMWSRAALQVHWLTDTLAGALLGFAAATIANIIWRGSGSIPSTTTEDSEAAL